MLILIKTSRICLWPGKFWEIKIYFFGVEKLLIFFEMNLITSISTLKSHTSEGKSDIIVIISSIMASLRI